MLVYFHVYAPWEEVEQYVKSSLFAPIKDQIGFLYCLNEPILYFATTSPAAINLIKEKFKIQPSEEINYNSLKIVAEHLKWGTLGRNDFFNF